MPGKPEPLRTLLGSSALAPLRAQMERQERLLQAVRRGLPEFLADHCRHCVAKDDRLLIYVDSAAWGSQLRFYGPSLLAHLEQSAGYRFRDVRLRSLVQTSERESPKRRVPAASAGAIVRESAENSTSDEIREALLRLSRTLERYRGRG